MEFNFFRRRRKKKLAWKFSRVNSDGVKVYTRRGDRDSHRYVKDGISLYSNTWYTSHGVEHYPFATRMPYRGRKGHGVSYNKMPLALQRVQRSLEYRNR